MNDLYSTSSYIKRGILFFLGVCVIALAYPTIKFFTAKPAGTNDPRELNTGLNASSDDQLRFSSSPNGYLYLLGVPLLDTEEVDQQDDVTRKDIYAIDILTDDLNILPTTPTSLSEMTDAVINGVFIGYYPDAVGTKDENHPGWVDYKADTWGRLETPSYWNEGKIQTLTRGVSDGGWIAYDAQPEYLDSEKTPGSFSDFANWHVVLFNRNTSEIRIIEDAAHPQWLNDGADVIYLTRNGIYRYNLASDASAPIDNSWKNLSRNSQIAVADDSSAMVLTVPDVNSVSVYTFTDSLNGLAILQGTIAESGVRFYDPVFDETNRFYALIRVNEADWNPDTQTFSPVVIEMRNLLDRKVLQSVVPSLDPKYPITLLDWRSDIEPYAFR